MEFIGGTSGEIAVVSLYLLAAIGCWWYSRRRRREAKARKFLARVTGEEDR
jgi:uncharacterized membrane protein YqjE